MGRLGSRQRGEGAPTRFLSAATAFSYLHVFTPASPPCSPCVASPHTPPAAAAPPQVVEERGFQKHPTWMNKCIQLYETYLVRHGIMVVGPAGSGKSAILDCLAGALTELGTKHVIWRMNPKAITAPQMFGRMDVATGGGQG